MWASFARHINTKDLQFASPLNEMYAYPPRTARARVPKELFPVGPKAPGPKASQSLPAVGFTSARSLIAQPGPPAAVDTDVEPDSPPPTLPAATVTRATLELSLIHI